MFWVWSPLGLFQILIILYLNIDVLKKYFSPQVQNSYLVEHLSMIASDSLLGEKQYDHYHLILIPSEKPDYALVYSLFLKYQVRKILLNNLLQTLCNLIVRRITKEGEFYNKYLDWGCVNK